MDSDTDRRTNAASASLLVSEEPLGLAPTGGLVHSAGFEGTGEDLEETRPLVSYLTIEEAYKRHRAAWQAAAAEYGSVYAVPGQVQDEIGMRTRAYLCLATPPAKKVCEDQTPMGYLKYYGFTEAFIESLGYTKEKWTPPLKQADKRKAAEAFWRENVGGQITAKDLEAASGWSLSKATTYITDHPHVFFKVKRGLYEVRDPKVERERDKQRVDG